MANAPELLLPESALPELIALDDAVLETLATVEQSAPPSLLNAYRRVVQRQVAAHIASVGLPGKPTSEGVADGSEGSTVRDPQQESVFHRNAESIRKVLSELSDRDREVLIRFYLSEQAPGQICRDMSLTEAQFRLMKFRAKARFGELMRNKLSERRGRTGHPEAA
jgi:RNA polymerase sigma-70 factor, ECF subfamily